MYPEQFLFIFNFMLQEAKKIQKQTGIVCREREFKN